MTDPAPPTPPPPGTQPQAAAPPRVVDDRGVLSAPQRQSWISPLFILLRGVRQLSFANIGVIAALATFGWIEFAVPIALALGLAAAVASWWRTTFYVADDELIVESGVISRERKTIPLGRVQSVTVEQNLVHRALNVVEAKVETAGSAVPEFTIQAVTRPVAESIRRLATQANEHSAQLDSAGTLDDAGLVPAPPEPGLPRGDVGEQILLHRNLGDIFKVALSSNPLVGLGTAAAAAFGISELLGSFFDISEERIDDAASNFFTSPLTIAVFVLAFVVLFVVSALITAMVPLHGLTLFRTPDGLRTASGLLSRRERIAALDRIQVLKTVRNPIEKLLGMTTVRLPTAGSVVGGGESVIRLPGTKPDELDKIAELIAPDPTMVRPLPNGISRYAIGRWTFWNGVGPALIMGATLWSFFRWWGLLAVLWFIPVALVSRRTQARWRWGVSTETLEVSNGAFTTEGSIMAVRKVQAVRVQQGIFHRRRKLASVKVSSAAGGIVVPHLPIAEARQLRDRLLAAAETDPRPFM